MNKQFELIVFDWDGTLFDSATAIAASIQNACRDLELPVPTVEQAKYVIGLGLHDAMERVVPGLDAERYPQIGERFRYHYLLQEHLLQLFDGIAVMLEQLCERGHCLAVATGKPRIGLDRLLNTTQTRHFFAATRAVDESFSKPHPGMLLDLMRELGVEAERTLMIGDTVHDIQMAHNAHASALAVSYGAHSVLQLAEMAPLACVHSVQELGRWLETNI